MSITQEVKGTIIIYAKVRLFSMNSIAGKAQQSLLPYLTMK
jgi:hypothetical protein